MSRPKDRLAPPETQRRDAVGVHQPSARRYYDPGELDLHADPAFLALHVEPRFRRLLEPQG